MSGCPQKQKELVVRKTLEKLSALDFSLPPPAMAKIIHSYISEITGNQDPYKELKEQSTVFALKLFPFLQEEVAKAENPFECAVRLSIAGNIIDFGANHKFKLDEVHQVISDALSAPLNTDLVKKLQSKMTTAKRILYVADNAGELVFDRLLIEMFPEKITLAVRGGEILNDVTRKEVKTSCIPESVKVVDTGDNVPGVIIEDCSSEFKDHFYAADIIIAKGQGNYETLDETDRPIFFLFKAKCAIVARNLGVKLGSLQIHSKNI
ncbi:MAG TPA: ARMT1-like domain-containing protein, partial [Victivallales bacterium]|nr:ARMT1-like domain-containing protein [Victivallales bacterium]